MAAKQAASLSPPWERPLQEPMLPASSPSKSQRSTKSPQHKGSRKRPSLRPRLPHHPLCQQHHSVALDNGSLTALLHRDGAEAASGTHLTNQEKRHAGAWQLRSKVLRAESVTLFPTDLSTSRTFRGMSCIGCSQPLASGTGTGHHADLAPIRERPVLPSSPSRLFC